MLYIIVYYGDFTISLFVRVPQVRSHEGQTVFVRVLRQGILPDAHVDQSPEERAVPVVPVSTAPGAGHADRLRGHRGRRHGGPKRQSDRLQHQNVVGYRRRPVVLAP